MIKIGNDNIGKIYLGNNQIGKAYLGSNLVFQKGSSPTPPTPPTPEPEFHTYLVFDGTAYIETGVTPPGNASYAGYCGRETLKAGQIIFSNLAGTSARMGANLGTNTNATSRTFTMYYGSSSANLTNSGSLAFTTNAYALFLTPQRWGLGNWSATLTKGNEAPSGPLVFGQNPTGSGTGYTGMISTFYIFNSDAQNATTYNDLITTYTPVATFRPCLYNGEAGMWHVEGNTFYGNSASSGTLSVFDPS